MRREVSRDRHSIDMASQHHALGAPEAGPRDHRVAVPVHSEMRERPHGTGDRVGQRFLGTTDRGHVHQARGERGRILGKI